MVKQRNGESVLSRVVRILEAFGPDAPVLRVSQIARHTGLHVATVSRLVEELVQCGWLQREPDRTVRVGVRIWELASRASTTRGLRDIALPFMEDLHAIINQHIQLGVRQDHEVLFVERLSAPGAVINFTRVAGRLPIHASSSGLVLLANSAPEFQDEVLCGPLRAFTPCTVTDPGTLRRMLAEVRKQGYAYCPGFFDVTAAGCAVPIRGPAGDVVAALAAIVPNDENARSTIPALQAAAHGISRTMGKAAVR